MGAALGGERDAELEAVVIRTLEEARRAGATSAEAAASRGAGLSVTARMNEVETIEHHRDKEIVVTVYFGNRTGRPAARTIPRSQCAIPCARFVPSPVIRPKMTARAGRCRRSRARDSGA
jgi:hypothetical protein